MKILSDNAFLDFHKWRTENYSLITHELTPLMKTTLIIEWLDSVDLFIEIKKGYKTNDYFKGQKGLKGWFYCISDKDFELLCKEENYHYFKPTRLEATQEAIKKANDIYNTRFSN